VKNLVLCQDIAPTVLELAGGKPGKHIQGRSLAPLFTGGRRKSGGGWRKSFLVEYWAENAYPWLIAMTYKAVRTDRHKYIHWVNRGHDGNSTSCRPRPVRITNVISARIAPCATACAASWGSCHPGAWAVTGDVRHLACGGCLIHLFLNGGEGSEVSGLLSVAAAVMSAVPWRTPRPTHQPVRIIVPFAPGGATDIVTRLLAQKLTEAWGQQILVDNRGGAGGNIGGELAAKSPPDGYTLFMTSGSIVTANQHIYRKMPFNPEKDLLPITNVASGPQIVAVHPTFPRRHQADAPSPSETRVDELRLASRLANASGGRELRERGRHRRRPRSAVCEGPRESTWLRARSYSLRPTCRRDQLVQQEAPRAGRHSRQSRR
jgi:hypothetical protein